MAQGRWSASTNTLGVPRGRLTPTFGQEKELQLTANKQQLIGSIIGGTFVAIVAIPSVYYGTANTGPGRWLINLQDNLLGYHSYKITVLILAMAIIALFAGTVIPFALAVRRLTGKTLIELFSDKTATAAEQVAEPDREHVAKVR